jgi:hypothetical protein
LRFSAPCLCVQEWRKNRHTEDFPTLAEALVVDCIDDVDDCVAVIVVFRPDRPYPALASEVPELEHGRGQSYLPGCMERYRQDEDL